MNKKAVFVALIISLAFSWGLWSKIQPSADVGKSRDDTSSPPKLEEKIPVLMVTKRIQAQTKLDGDVLIDCFKVVDVASSAVPPDAISSVASISQKFSSVSLFPGDIMTKDRLLDENFVGNLARAVPSGKRAFTIAVDKVTSVGGFIRQGDFVDVIANVRPRNGTPLSKVILQDILVLTAGTTYSVDNSVASATPAISAAKVELVTLAVTPEELERLMFMESEPSVSLRLVLKHPDDTGKRIVTSGENEKTLLQALSAESAVTTVVAAPQESETTPAPRTIETVVLPTQEELSTSSIVEVQYGSRRREELTKYSGPGGRYKKLPGMPGNRNVSHYGDTSLAME